MNKAIKILSIIALVFSGLAFLLAGALLTFLWEPAAGIYYVDTLSQGPVIPIGTIINMLGCLVITILLLTSLKPSRFIVIEILSIVFLIIVLPAIVNVLSMYQAQIINMRMGMDYIYRFSITNSIMIWPVRLVGMASSICLVVCGMRLGTKSVLRKQWRG